VNRKDQGDALDVDFTDLPLRLTKMSIGAKPCKCKLDKKDDVSEATVDNESLPGSTTPSEQLLPNWHVTYHISHWAKPRILMDTTT
jgi:hypothetical protein